MIEGSLQDPTRTVTLIPLLDGRGVAPDEIALGVRLTRRFRRAVPGALTRSECSASSQILSPLVNQTLHQGRSKIPAQSVRRSPIPISVPRLLSTFDQPHL
jgi:hypothetical protein